MPVVHSLSKVNKNLAKSTGQIHPKGRKFKQLNRATLREQKITAKKIQHQEKKDNQLLVVKFLQEAIQSRDDAKFSLDDIKLFIEAFLSKHDDELDRLRSERRSGRPATARQQILEEKVKYEQSLYETGYKIPDLSDENIVKRLRAWNGSVGGSSIFRYIHVSKDMKSLKSGKDEEMTD